MKVVIAALCLLGTGCQMGEPLPPISLTPQNAETAPPPGAEQAIALAWSVINPRAEEAPQIIWVEGPYLNLEDPERTSTIGLYVESLHTAWVVAKEKPSYTAMPHELVHADLNMDHGDCDADHTSEEWRKVPELRNLLQRNGL